MVHNIVLTPKTDKVKLGLEPLYNFSILDI